MTFRSHHHPNKAAYLKIPPPSTPASSRPWALIMRTRNFCLRLGAGEKHYNIKWKAHTMQLRPRPFVWRKLVSGKVATRVPELLTYNSLQNLANRLCLQVNSARRVTLQPGLPFADGRVILLDGPAFLHIKTGSPGRVNLVEARQSEHGRTLLSALGSDKLANFSRSLKGYLSRQDNLSSRKRVLAYFR